jgi:hypothetical protein
VKRSTPLKRRTPLASVSPRRVEREKVRSTPLDRVEAPRKSSARVARRDWTEPREKVDAEGRCRVCARTGLKIDAAHIVPRSRVVAGPGEHPDNIVPLCHERCHPAYDAGELDLLPFLTLGEQGYATELVGLVEAMQRTTGCRWVPEPKTTAAT